MKDYKSYMDRVHTSELFHQRLLNLKQPAGSRAPWKKFGALAACAVLLAGVSIFCINPVHRWNEISEAYTPEADSNIAADIALVDPDGDIEPGMKTIPGFEVTSGTGANATVTYYVLPWIDYGSKDAAAGTSTSLDYAAPEDSTWRAITREDVRALAGGEEALDTLLNWDGFEFSGSATFNADGTVWQLCFAGKRDDFYFVLELAPDALPLTCIVTEPRTVTELWGVEVTARYSGIYGEGANREVWMPESREVEFIANGVGCRFTLYGLEGESSAVETMVARFVRHAILEGLDLTALNAEGVCAAGAPAADAGEPSWRDSSDTPSTPPSEGAPVS